MRTDVSALEVSARTIRGVHLGNGAVRLVVTENGSTLGARRKKPSLQLQLDREAVQDLAAILAEALSAPAGATVPSKP